MCHHHTKPFPDRTHAVLALPARLYAPSIAPGYHTRRGPVLTFSRNRTGEPCVSLSGVIGADSSALCGTSRRQSGLITTCSSHTLHRPLIVCWRQRMSTARRGRIAEDRVRSPTTIAQCWGGSATGAAGQTAGHSAGQTADFSCSSLLRLRRLESRRAPLTQALPPTGGSDWRTEERS